MDGVDRIIMRIGADCEAECQSILSAAETRAAEITAEYVKRAQDAYDLTYAAAEAEAHSQYERLAQTAQSEAKKRMLAERQSLVLEAMDRAVSIIRSKPDAEYAAILAKFAADASRSGAGELIFSPDERDSIGAQTVKLANDIIQSRNIRPNITLSDRTASITGGVIISEGDTEVNCDLRVFALEVRRETEPQIAAVLFS